MSYRYTIKCPHCAYECTYRGDNRGSVDIHGTHRGFYHTGGMERTEQYGPTQHVNHWGCPACAKTFIELPPTKG